MTLRWPGCFTTALARQPARPRCSTTSPTPAPLRLTISPRSPRLRLASRLTTTPVAAAHTTTLAAASSCCGRSRVRRLALLRAAIRRVRSGRTKQLTLAGMAASRFARSAACPTTQSGSKAASTTARQSPRPATRLHSASCGAASRLTARRASRQSARRVTSWLTAGQRTVPARHAAPKPARPTRQLARCSSIAASTKLAAAQTRCFVNAAICISSAPTTTTHSPRRPSAASARSSRAWCSTSAGLSPKAIKTPRRACCRVRAFRPPSRQARTATSLFAAHTTKFAR